MTEETESGHERPDPITVADIVADLRLLRERGLVRIRHTELSALRMAVSLTDIIPPEALGPRAVEALLRAAVGNLGGGQLSAAAEHTFGLHRGDRDRPAQDRRRRAAQEYGVSLERFRKHHERVVIEQVAEEILELCRPQSRRRPPDIDADAGTPQVPTTIHLQARSGGTHFPVIVHVEPVELLRDVDVVVAPTNIYLEMPQPYKASISAALRRATPQRAPDGAVVADEVVDELRSWVRDNGRPGMPVAVGSVAPTSAGALRQQGIRRIYHAAVASPQPGTNDYDVTPAAITLAVHATFDVARSERGRFSPPLESLVFPLLGAGRGGLDPATSFAWIWAAIEHEMRADNTWKMHFVTHQRTTADVIVAGIIASGGVSMNNAIQHL
jgi:O-acetyl-ADP-ribose deacetylase (regulator of RNase III)